jgi:hypothetical protein
MQQRSGGRHRDALGRRFCGYSFGESYNYNRKAFSQGNGGWNTAVMSTLERKPRSKVRSEFRELKMAAGGLTAKA